MISSVSRFFITIAVSLTVICVLNYRNTVAASNVESPPSKPSASGDSKLVVEKLPFCGDDKKRETSSSLLYVTTLDGKISALDIGNDGKLMWNVSTGPGTLLSSSIHRLELTNNGKWIRMIPSLNGGLYKFDGETVEPIPVTADDLLSSSFKFSDDLVFSGGKEISSYGVSARTGQILYTCTLGGCKNSGNELTGTDTDTQKPLPNSNEDVPDDASTTDDVQNDEVIIVRRQTQTVRAVEPRTGEERWNFSVGLHELELHKREDCHEHSAEEQRNRQHIIDVTFKIIVPEGIILAVDRNNPNVVVWKHQFDYPIVNAWRTNKEMDLEKIDMFSSAQWLWDVEANMDTKSGLITPSLYVGMHQKQLYIQESNQMQQLIMHDYQNRNDKNHKIPKMPWKPFPATSTALQLIDYDRQLQNIVIEDSEECEGADCDVETPVVTALSVLHGSEYVNGNGFYLYSEQDTNVSNNVVCPMHGHVLGYGDGGILMVFKMLWNWREITVLSLTLGFVAHTLSQSYRRYNKNRQRVIVVARPNNDQHDIFRNAQILEELQNTVYPRTPIDRNAHTISQNVQTNLNQPSNIAIPEISVNGVLPQQNIVPLEPPVVASYQSRFLTDFDMVQCLGHGGFGVVFEMKNKLDACHYAIKRITMSNNPGSRDRVMREVKTLAHCEHQNIVRYFQSWVETPPDGWQDIEDQKWLKDVSMSENSLFQETSGGDLPHKPSVRWTNNTLSNGSVAETLSNYVHKNNASDMCIEFRDSSCSDPVTTNHRRARNHERSDSVSITVDDEHSFTDRPHKSDSTCSSDGVDPDDSDSGDVVFQRSTSDNVMFKYTASDKVSGIGYKKLKKDKKADAMPKSRMYLYIQMQLCQKESLKDWLKNKRFDKRQPEVIKVFQQIVGAVEYVHLKGLIHRDLKPSNIFFSMDGQIKIGDFGLVTDMRDIVTKCGDETGLPSCPRHTQHVGTHLYMSPEQLQGRHYDYKVDIYSLGLIFFELLSDFGTEMEHIETLKSLRKSEFPRGFAESHKDEYNLLKLMLSPQPMERPTTMGIRSHPPLGCIPPTDEQWHFELPPIGENIPSFIF